MKVSAALLPLFLGVSLLAMACGQPAAATPGPTPTQQAGPASPTSTPAVADTPTPTATLPPADTPEAPPTFTPEPPATSTPTLEPSTPTPEPTPAPATRESDIAGFALESFTVPVGTTVTWTNRDTAPHTVTSGAPGAADSGSAFDSGQSQANWLAQGETFSFTFSQPGQFAYYCFVHPSMTATVTVVE